MMGYLPLRFGVAMLTMMIDAPAFAAQWRSIPAEGTLEFVVTFEGAEARGIFQIFGAELEFEPDSHTASSLRVTVDVRSATMSSADLDEAIAEKTWFDSATYPEANFSSKVIQQTGEQEFVAQGAVSIKGVERDLELPLHWSGDGSLRELSGSVTLSRVDFGIGTGEWQSDSSIGHAVQVIFKLMMERAD
jgi:polyisoprenoid-binding protein YceI